MMKEETCTNKITTQLIQQDTYDERTAEKIDGFQNNAKKT